MAKDKGIVSIYLNKDELKELDRRCNYKRISRNEWVKNRVLSALNMSKS